MNPVSTFAVTVALSLGATPFATSAIRAAAEPSAPQIRAILESSRSTTSAARSVAMRGAEVIPVLFAALRDGRWADGVSLSDDDRAVLIGAMGRLGSPLREHIEPFTSGSAQDRNAALMILSEVGEAVDLLLAQRLATGDGTDGRTPIWFEIAVRGILVRDASEAHRKLDRLWSKVSDEQRLPVVRAVGVAGQREGLDFLQEVLGGDDSVDGAILQQVERIAADLVPPAEYARVDRIRSLLDSDQPALRAGAALCLGAFEDAESTPLIIAALGDPDPMVRDAAHRALRGMTGHTFGASAKRWQVWYDDELRWADGGRDDALDRLSDDDPARVAAAVREVSHHRLGRDPLARELFAALSHSDPDIRALTCSCLAQLGSRAAVEELVERLERDDADVVREAATRALVEITERDLPPDFEAWRAEFPDIGF